MAEEIKPEQSRQLLAAIVDSSDDAIIGKNLNGIITNWNGGARRIFGYTAEEIIGKPILTLIPPELHSEEAQIIGRIRRGERVDHFETRRVAKDGRILEISLTVSPIRDAEGEIVGASKIARDITERKRVERELAEAQAQLKSHAAELERRVAERTRDLQMTIAELESFSYSLTHDLRAPLRAVQSYLQIFLEDHASRLDAAGTTTLERAIASAQRMDRMVLDLLAFTRLSHEAMPIEAIDAGKIIEALLTDNPEFQRSQAEFSIGSPLPKVMGNQASLVQCLANLMDNAVKFVAPGVRPRVKIYAEEAGTMVRLWVGGQRYRIKPDDRPRLFSMFHRLSGNEYPGTGIGLAIVRKAVERMGGSAGIESEPGEGSRFWLQLHKAVT